MPNPATPHAPELKPSTISALATSAREGSMLYCQIERHDAGRLRHELGERLAIRGLGLASEGPGWLRVVRRITRAHQLAVQGDSCAVVACGGRIQWGACRRCGTKP